MKSRLDRIIVGCNFVSSLIRDKKEGSEFFKRAALRLIRLLKDEIDNVPETVETMTQDQLQAIFSDDKT